MNTSRACTRELLELVENGLFDNRVLIRDLLNWMSEQDVQEFMESNGLLESEDEE